MSHEILKKINSRGERSLRNNLIQFSARTLHVMHFPSLSVVIEKLDFVVYCV